MPDHPNLRASPLAPMDCGSPRSYGRNQRDVCHRPTRELSDRRDSSAHPTLRPTPKPVEARPGFKMRFAINAAAEGPSPATGQPQDETRWDPHALPLAWCTAAAAQRTRTKIAAVLLKLATEEEEIRASACEPVDDVDDVSITTPTAEPITVRTMTTEEPPRMTAAEEPIKPWTTEEPVTMGVIVPHDPEEDLRQIQPTIALLGGGPATPKPILGEGDEWVQLERGDPFDCYLRDKYKTGQRRGRFYDFLGGQSCRTIRGRGPLRAFRLSRSEGGM
ncbi:hypothetical protein GQX74_014281 [Glossina fuscipes]|nr:hypothetical protein GQX74_014281 [Glossina fuscipes]